MTHFTCTTKLKANKNIYMHKNMLYKLTVALTICCIAVVESLRPDYIGEIAPPAQTNWGEWGAADWCPPNHFAYAYSLRSQGDQNAGDDTSLNGIRLYCKFVKNKEIKK
jgi:hypothetical protein